MKGKKIKAHIVAISAIGCMLICLAAGITALMEKEEKTETVAIEEETSPLLNTIYDSEDTAILLGYDTEEKTIQFQNIQTGKRYTLQYDGATKLYDKYGQSATLAQTTPGMLVNLQFYKETRHLTKLSENTDCFHLEHIEKYKLDIEHGTLVYQDKTYRLNSHLSLLSNTKEISLMDINSVDVLSIWGYSDQIYSIQIEKGHGYLRLQNETYFVDGWIEIGQDIIKKVTEDMLIVVPEGTYDVSVSHNGSRASQKINFIRNEEIAWDLGTVEIVLPKTGTILFTITPDTAKVVIDGSIVDISQPVELTYGVHQITITASGYDTLAKYIKVGAASANIAIDLEKNSQDDTNESKTEKETEQKTDKETDKTTDTTDNAETKENTETEETTTEAQTQALETASSTYKVHIDSPEGVEVYLDGNYIGIAPVDFKKEPGSYIVTLRKDGYQTRSYTLQVDDEEKDVTFSFSKLIAK